jgi:hypothetical protein
MTIWDGVFALAVCVPFARVAWLLMSIDDERDGR